MLGVYRIKKMHLFFSHTLTDEQVNDAQESLGVQMFANLSEPLLNKWKNIPVDKESIKMFMEQFCEYIDNETTEGEYILIQGDYGAVYFLVNYSLKQRLIPVYSTTERKVITEKIGNKIVKKSEFQHVRFRRYEGINDE